MMRAAALVFALALLAAAPARAQDSTPAPRTGVVRPRATQPGTGARTTAPTRPRSTRPRATRPRPPARTPARDTARDSARVAAPAPPPGFAYQARAQPDTVTVGDRFASGMAVSVPAGTAVALEFERDTADRWRVLGDPRVTPRDSARTRWTVAANMVAWQPGLPDSLPAVLRLTGRDGRVTKVPVTLAFPTVRAVLPADSAQWRVRPPHDVWGPSVDKARVAMLGVLALLGILLLALLAWLVVRVIRRRRARVSPATARARALALLDRARTSGFIEAGNWKAFYTLVAEALRGFVASVEPRLSEDLTSSEVIEGIRGRVPDDDAETLEHLLRVSDLAKFARHGRAPDDARRDLELARTWIEGYVVRTEPAVDDTATEPAAAGAAP
ncbi:MAG TPA: hypothetical protein VFJ16_08445 [Longimicrobium sp.]|nr:hypothetical protein [Longimicrobium sp.]